HAHVTPVRERDVGREASLAPDQRRVFQTRHRTADEGHGGEDRSGVPDAAQRASGATLTRDRTNAGAWSVPCLQRSTSLTLALRRARDTELACRSSFTGRLPPPPRAAPRGCAAAWPGPRRGRPRTARARR